MAMRPMVVTSGVGRAAQRQMHAWAAALVCALLLVLAAHPAQAGDDAVTVKLIAINDFHGHLRPPPGGLRVIDPGRAEAPTVVPAGGVERMATLIDRLRRKNPRNIFLSAGDLVGASPLLSSLFEDEPVIEAMNLLGLDFSAVGNHEFDRGVAHLRRLQDGGCPPGGCKSLREFNGARFQLLAANLTQAPTGDTILPPFGVREFDGVPIAIIGVGLSRTPSLVPAASAAGLDFEDEADSVNRLVPMLKRKGIEAIVVLVHEGAQVNGHFNECANQAGRLPEIVRRLDPAVDVVISGHTHQAYVCRISGKLVTSASSYGRLVTAIDLTLDRRTRDVLAATATNHVVDMSLPRAPALTRLLAAYEGIAGPHERRVVGRIAATFTQARDESGESLIGRLIADAQEEAARAIDGAAFALMNWGGIRAPLTYRSDGTVTYADAFAVHPFGNTLVTMTLTGRQILQLPSSGLFYAWSADCPPGQRVQRDSVRISGAPLVPDKDYRVTVNSFLAGGGDRFFVLASGRAARTGELDIDALLQYLGRHSPVAPDRVPRIRQVSATACGAMAGVR
jgi:5'-nucleotidase